MDGWELKWADENGSGSVGCSINQLALRLRRARDYDNSES